MSKNKIIINTAKNKETYVTVKGKNNKIIAVTETYKRIQGAEKAAESLKRIVKQAVIVNNQPWVASSTYDSANKKGYVILRPWGEKNGFIIEGNASSLHAVYADNNFIVAFTFLAIF